MKPRFNPFLRIATLASILLVQHSFAADLYWDADGAATTGTGGAGTWLTTNTWRTGSSTGTLGDWADTNNAVFGGTAGVISVGSVSVGNMTVSVSDTFNGGTITFSGGNLSISAAATINSALAGSVVFTTGVSTASSAATIAGNNTGLTSTEIALTSTNQLVFNPSAFATGTTVKITSGYLGLNTTGGLIYNTGNINFAGGAIRGRGAAALFTAASSLSANSKVGTVSAGNSLELSGAINLNTYNLALGETSTMTNGNVKLSNQISGVGGSITNAFGRNILSASNSYTGGSSVTGGTLQFVKTASMPATGTVAVSSGAALAVNIGGTGEWTTGGSGAGTVAGLLAGTGGQGNTVTYGASVALGFDTTNASAAQSYSTALTNSSATGATTLGIAKYGTGTLTLSALNTYTGTTTLGGGTLEFKAASGTPAQTLGALAVAAGPDSTLKSTLDTATSIFTTFSGTISRAAGGSANIVLSGGVAGTDNKVTVSGGTAAALVDRGVFFAGSSYAAYGTGGLLRAYGTGDTAYVASPTAATVGTSSATSNFDLTTGNITAQTTASANTINLRANNLTLSTTGQTLSVNGILSAGSSSAVIATAGKIQPTASGGEMVIRVNGTSDVLRIDPIIQNNSTGAAPLTKSGDGTMVLTAANTYTGNTYINGGTLQIGNNGTSGALSTSSAIINNANLQFNRADAVLVQGTNFANNITGSGSLTQAGSGTVTLNGANTYTGATTVNAGTLTLNSGVTLGTSGITVNGGTLSQLSTTLSNSITVNAGGTLSGEGSTTGSLTFGAGNSNLAFDSSTITGAFTADSIISSGASVLLTPSGVTTIGTTYTILKQTTGSFSGSPAANFIAASRGTLAFANSNKDLTLTPTAAASLTWKGNAANPSYWDVASTLNWTNGGSDRFYANDAVTFDDNASSFTVAAQTSVSPGSIVINNTTNAYAFSGSGIVSSGTLTKSGSNAAVVGNTMTSTGVVVNNGTLTLSAANTIGASGVEVNGGILNLNAANTFTSGITLNGGTLNATVGTNATTGSLGSFAAARTVTLNGGALSYGGSTLSSDNINLSVTANSSIGVSNSASTLRAGGTFTGSGDLTINGSGVVALGKNTANATYGNGFTGNIVVSNGATFSLRNQNSMGSTAGGVATGTTTVQNGGTLLLDPFSQTSISFNSETLAFQGASTLTNRLNGQTSLTTAITGSVSTAGTLTVNTREDVVTSNAVSLELSGAVTGNGGIDFGTTGGRAGTYIVSNGSNGYLGATNVKSGTLVVSGNISTSSLTTVESGAALKGTGTVGALTVAGGGTLAPGNSPGTLTVGGTLSLENLSILAFELNPTDFTVGGGINDLITGVTNLTLDGLLNVTATTGSFTGVTSGVWRLFNYTGSLTDNAVTLNSMPTLDMGYSWSLDTATANQVNLTIVPEPNVAALLGGLGVLALLRRRRA